MTKFLLLFALITTALFAQYSAEPGGEPPSELAPAIAAELSSPGTKIVTDDGKVFGEIWLRNNAAEGPDSSEMDVTWTTMPHGTLLGAIRFPAEAADRRAQKIAPGVYTLRFSYYPIDGAHQGVEPSRDFLILTPAADDTDPAATPKFDELMDWSRKASGTNHPAALAIWKEDMDWQEGFAKLGEHDWVLSAKIGDAQVSIILIGTNEHDM
ncbi:MAG: hypothetical protein GY953_33955 [bacterium]|nr:hypothetical protein [bacterium]